jgi:hypothetical protein
VGSHDLATPPFDLDEPGTIEFTQKTKTPTSGTAMTR